MSGVKKAQFFREPTEDFNQKKRKIKNSRLNLKKLY
jgi:hypothetical protein